MKIQNINDVKNFFKKLKSEGLNFHPDNKFEDYINYHTKRSSYSLKEQIELNKSLYKSFIVCNKENVDIYELCWEIFVETIPTS